jgi:hypothetical protein
MTIHELRVERTYFSGEKLTEEELDYREGSLAFEGITLTVAGVWTIGRRLIQWRLSLAAARAISVPKGAAGSGVGSASGQLTENACGMACGQKLLSEQGISVFQSNLTKGFYKGLTPENLAANLNRQQPGWKGFMADLTQRDIAGLYSVHGKYIARIGGNPGHFVTVESVSNGVVKFWDPSGGVIKTQSIETFTDMATGVVFR